MKENIIEKKSYQFAIRIIKLYKYLIETNKEYTLGKQLLRSGTSIGANVKEAEGAQSRNDFIAKISIAYKESKETLYWIELLRDTNYISKEQADSILIDAEEICKILAKIQLTTNKRTYKK
jgi:four helix bundle protein